VSKIDTRAFGGWTGCYFYFLYTEKDSIIIKPLSRR